MFRKKYSSVLLATYNFEYQDSEAKYIRFNGEDAIHCILGGHVSTAYIIEMIKDMVKREIAV